LFGHAKLHNTINDVVNLPGTVSKAKSSTYALSVDFHHWLLPQRLGASYSLICNQSELVPIIQENMENDPMTCSACKFLGTQIWQHTK